MEEFKKTRIILTLWYSFILAIILVSFSLALYFALNSDVERIVLMQNFGNNIPKVLTPEELNLVLAQVGELRKTFALDLAIIDFATFVLGSVLSYILAGKTLEPIRKTLESQKNFIADASHELKNPIASIQTTSEVILRSKNKTVKDYQKVVSDVLDETKRLGRLVNQLLTLSLLDSSNTKTFSFTICNLSKIVKKELDLAAPLIENKKIKITENITKDIKIKGDSDKLKQLLIILLDNATKYTPKYGQIKVTLNKNSQLIVEDNGIGISKEKQENIFKRFYQADQSHSKEGSGLGLSIAKSIVELHHGKISVESVQNKGSKFICSFPKN